MSIVNSKPAANIPPLCRRRFFDVVKRGLFVGLGGLLISCQSVQRDHSHAFPPQPNQVATMAGRWIDLEQAATEAMSDIGMRPTEIDRWQSAVRFVIVTEKGRPGELLVLGDRETGIESAEARIGRFGDPAREAELLGALKHWLNKMKDRPRLSGAK